MKKIAIVTDSNSGISPEMADHLGIYVIPMPVVINKETYYEGVNITREDFYEKLSLGMNIVTSQPRPADVSQLWEDLLANHDSIVYIPMSSALSGSYQTSAMIAEKFDEKVHVVNNQRISVSQRQATLDALEMKYADFSASQIKEALEKDKFNSSIYITVNTLKHLKKGGRITPAVAAIGSILKIKPILQIQGEKLDAYSKTRTMKNAEKIMIAAIKDDISSRFADEDEILLQIAHTNKDNAAKKLKEELEVIFPDYPIFVDHLPLSIACHLGEGAIGIGCIKKIKIDDFAKKFTQYEKETIK